jgi:hypothetical protein
MTEDSKKHIIPTDANNVLVAGVPLVDGEYYRINGTKKILYWDGSQWMKPVKDQQKRYGAWNTHLDKQPTNIKSVELVDIYVCH